MRRRDIIAGAAAFVGMAAREAEAQARTVALPGGGRIAAPAGYKTPDREMARQVGQQVVLLYRNLTTNMGGHAVCDGLIVVARRDQFTGLDAFATATAAAATSGWQSGRLSADGRTFEAEQEGVSYGDGQQGIERIRPLSVSIVGFWRQYYSDGWQIAFDHPRGLWIQIFILEKDGGQRKARRLAADIAASFTG